jgi:hypothetical protein
MPDESLTPVETTSERLLPCPFCMGAAEEDFFPRANRIACSTLDCPAHTGFLYDTEAEAIAAWNRRGGGAVTMDEGRRIEGWSHPFGATSGYYFVSDPLSRAPAAWQSTTLIIRAPAPTTSSPTEVNEK